MACKKCDGTGLYLPDMPAGTSGYAMQVYCDCIAGVKAERDHYRQAYEESRAKQSVSLYRSGHMQIVHFTSGLKRTIKDVREIWENEMTHIIDGDNRHWVINKDNVAATEIIGDASDDY